MKSYSDSKSTEQNFSFTKVYPIVEAKNDAEKLKFRKDSRKIFSNNLAISKERIADLKKANFFTEYESVFKTKYADFYADNKSLFSKAKPKAKPQAKPKAKPQANTIK